MSLSLLSAGTMNQPVMGEMKLQMGRIEISCSTTASAGQSVIPQQGKSSTSVLHSVAIIACRSRQRFGDFQLLLTAEPRWLMRSGDARGDAFVFSRWISPSHPAASQRPQRLREANWLTRSSSPRDLLLRRICKLLQTVAFLSADSFTDRGVRHDVQNCAVHRGKRD